MTSSQEHCPSFTAFPCTFNLSLCSVPCQSLNLLKSLPVQINRALNFISPSYYHHVFLLFFKVLSGIIFTCDSHFGPFYSFLNLFPVCPKNKLHFFFSKWEMGFLIHPSTQLKKKKKLLLRSLRTQYTLHPSKVNLYTHCLQKMPCCWDRRQGSDTGPTKLRTS